MVAFILAAAVMAALAAAAVAVPLLRHRGNRIVGAVSALLLVALASGLYPLWSSWDWNATATGHAVSPEVAAMVAKLEKHLAEQPTDLEGWLMLGRSYEATGRIDEAIVAFDHAHQLDGGKNVEATLGLGEAISMKAGGEVTPQAAQLFEQALAQEPRNPRALLFGGFSAAVQGDAALARTRWETLKAMHPPAQIVQMLDERLAELASIPGGASDAMAGAPAVAGDRSVDSRSPPEDRTAKATVNLTIAPALKARLRAGTPLFVFAREPGSRGPPLAAKRLTDEAIGTRIELSAADSMMPGRALASGQRVSITARVSFSGQPTPASGDLFGELTYDVGRDGVRDLVIDQVAP
jgi:cytochrome c-type biogenesis protein CcmH